MVVWAPGSTESGVQVVSWESLSWNVPQPRLRPLPFFSGRPFPQGSKTRAYLLPAGPHQWKERSSFPKVPEVPGRILRDLASLILPSSRTVECGFSQPLEALKWEGVQFQRRKHDCLLISLPWPQFSLYC